MYNLSTHNLTYCEWFQFHLIQRKYKPKQAIIFLKRVNLLEFYMASFLHIYIIQNNI